MKSGQKGQSQEQVTRTTVDNFNEIFNRHDADGLAPFLTEHTMFENILPAPDGRRIEGKAAVIEFWRGWFVRNSDARFDAEEVIVSGSRATALWVYRKMRNGQPWHLRDVDVFTVRDRKIAAKLAYVKGWGHTAGIPAEDAQSVASISPRHGSSGSRRASTRRTG